MDLGFNFVRIMEIRKIRVRCSVSVIVLGRMARITADNVLRYSYCCQSFGLPCDCESIVQLQHHIACINISRHDTTTYDM
jgi:hypothetical protein